MKKYDENSKVLVGSLLKRARFESGAVQREIAIELGLPNYNFISMIESGRNSVPIKRLFDIGEAYRLRRLEVLAIIKLTIPDLWQTVSFCIQQVGMSQTQWDELDVKIDEVIGSIADEKDM